MEEGKEEESKYDENDETKATKNGDKHGTGVDTDLFKQEVDNENEEEPDFD